MTNLYERMSIPTQDISVIGDYDVVVCGAGPAGIGATVDAASAGAQFHKGDPEDGRLQHANFRFSMEGINAKELKQDCPSEEVLLEMIKVAQKEGKIRPPRGLFSPAPETFPYDLVNHRMNHGYWEIQGVDSTDPVSVSETLCDCHQAAMYIMRFCREQLPGYEECRVGKLPTLLGVRESRRILGHYLLTRRDVLDARKFEDGIARASFWIDFHDSPPGQTLPYSLDYVKAMRPAEGDWYEIPYRCLVPKDVSGILVAGRCISCDRDAQASLRVMPTCFFTGAAAGRAATISVSQGILPHELDGQQVRKLLRERNILLS